MSGYCAEVLRWAVVSPVYAAWFRISFVLEEFRWNGPGWNGITQALISFYYPLLDVE